MATLRSVGEFAGPPTMSKTGSLGTPQPNLKLAEQMRNQQSHQEQPKRFEMPPTADLIRLLRFMESELQTRDAAISVLKAEKVKHTFYQAKYSRFGLSDPFHALQRDSDHVREDSFDESAVRTMFDSQLGQLENLIATQRKAQLRMREQLMLAEKKYNKVCLELEEEKQKHAQDTAKGDDVTVALEKDRERLKQEIEFERSQNKKLEKDLRKACQQLDEQQRIMEKHKQVAVGLIKERRKMVAKVLDAERLNEAVAQQLQKEKEDSTRQETSKLMQMEAKMERQLSEFDIEREQLRAKLRREEARVADLVRQLDALRQQLRQNTSQQKYPLVHQPKSEDQPSSAAAAAAGCTTTDSSQQQHCIVDMGSLPLGLARAADSAASDTKLVQSAVHQSFVPDAGAAALCLPVRSVAPALHVPPSLALTLEAVLSPQRPKPGVEAATSPSTRLPSSIAPQSQHPATSPARIPAALPDWLVANNRLGSSPHSLPSSSTKSLASPICTSSSDAAVILSSASLGTQAVLPAAAPTSAAAAVVEPGESPSRTAAPGRDELLRSAGVPKVAAAAQKSASPLPASRKPLLSSSKGAAPPVPPNKPNIVLVSKLPASAMADAVDASSTAGLPHTPQPAAASPVGTLTTGLVVDPLSKPVLPDGMLVTRVAMAPPSPGISAKQRPPPPQRVVSLQKPLLGPPAAAPVSSSSSSVGAIARKPAAEVTDFEK